MHATMLRARDMAGHASAAGGPVHITGTDWAREREEDEINRTISVLEYEQHGSQHKYFSFGNNRTVFSRFLGYMLYGGGNNAHPPDAEPASAMGHVDESLIVEREVDMSLEPEQQAFRHAYQHGRVLAMSKDPLDVLRGDQTFHQRLCGFARRICQYADESSAPETTLRLRAWLEDRWQPTGGLACVEHDASRSAEDTLAVLKDLMVWFKREYPYYYDNCLSCGNANDNTFLGVVCPSQPEKVHKAGRTELYWCTSCGSVSRFSRFNDALHTLFHSRRGRCGEYSIVALALVEALGYRARWIVDWADHLWVEVRVGERWVHLDPCEAAVDEPLLYESWGKQQTYIMALTRESVEDVTSSYTSDFAAA